MQDEKLIRVAREKDQILALFRQKGMRVTKQRKLILDIVFEYDCISCKEIYYQALKTDKNVGIATVYRMVNALADLGVFRTNVPYRPAKQPEEGSGNGCRIVLKNQTIVEFEECEWQSLLAEALRRKGYENSANQPITKQNTSNNVKI